MGNKISILFFYFLLYISGLSNTFAKNENLIKVLKNNSITQSIRLKNGIWQFTVYYDHGKRDYKYYISNGEECEDVYLKVDLNGGPKYTPGNYFNNNVIAFSIYDKDYDVEFFGNLKIKDSGKLAEGEIQASGGSKSFLTKGVYHSESENFASNEMIMTVNYLSGYDENVIRLPFSDHYIDSIYDLKENDFISCQLESGLNRFNYSNMNNMSHVFLYPILNSKTGKVKREMLSGQLIKYNDFLFKLNDQNRIELNFLYNNYSRSP